MSLQRPTDAISILHEEPDWLVVSKPAGVHSVSQRASEAATVEEWLRATRAELAELDECGIAHRLDLETSGCLAVAKSEACRARLREAFSGRGGDVRKTYLALARAGSMRLGEHGSFTLSFTSRHKGSAKVTVQPRGEPDTVGRCRWTVRWVAGGLALLEVELIGPGRRHQIRAGLAHIGSPLVGDALYAGPSADRVHLHAWRLEIDGILVESPPPVWVAAVGR